jgi:hypothetical protein
MLVGNLKVCYCALDNPSIDVVIKSNCIETIPRVTEVPLDLHWENHFSIIQMFYVVVNLHRSFSFIPIGEFLVTHNCEKIHSPLLHELLICLTYIKILQICKSRQFNSKYFEFIFARQFFCVVVYGLNILIIVFFFMLLVL